MQTGKGLIMDLSKLPRMSQTPAPPPSADDPGAPPPPIPTATAANLPDYGYEPSTGPLAEAWISLAIGVILLLMFFRPIEYLLTSKQSFEQKYTFSDANGPLTYPQTVFFFGDVAIVSFAFVLIIDGLILFTRKPRLIAAALVFTVITVLLNLAYVVRMMNGYGLQFASALAVAFGVYIAIFQWKLLQSLRMAQAWAASRGR